MDSDSSFQRRPLGSFSGPAVAPCSSEGSRMFSLDSSSSPNAHVGFQPPMSDAEVGGQEASGGSCR